MWSELALALAATAPSGYIGSAACAGCHGEVAKAYASHPMRRGSGPVREAPLPALSLPGVVDHATSGVSYRVDRSPAGTLVVDYERRTDPPLRGRIEASHYVGGSKGLSFLHERDGYLYQVPISFYLEGGGRWGASPGFEEGQLAPLSRPAQLNCVECHFSGAAHEAGTTNRFGTPPYAEGGVACERCHGPGAAHRDHVRRGGKSPWQIVQPARLAPAERDSLCAQCHLQGAARVPRLGCGLQAFRPGQALGDVAAEYVWTQDSGPLDQTSHFQKLWQSACHAKSGGKLGCISCHDPHRTVPVPDRARYYRQRCQQCHAEGACTGPAEARRARGDDCAGCHMPRAPNETVAHAVSTDHSIPRFPGGRAAAKDASRSLVPFWGGVPSARELGLAFFSLANDRARFRPEGEEQLRRAFGAGARDASVLILLATSLEAGGAPERALPLYEQGVRAEPGACADLLAVGENRLGALLAARGRVEEAVALFGQSLQRTPAYEAARVNLVRARVNRGEREEALRVLREGLALEPDSPNLRQLRLLLEPPR